MKIATGAGMSIEGKEFSESITSLVKEKSIKKVIETGTYIGTGSTMILAKALAGVEGAQIYTIEVNPEYHRLAKDNLANYPHVNLLQGLSLPRRLLLTREQTGYWIDHLKDKDIYVDHKDEDRIDLYVRECDYSGPVDLLGRCIKVCRGKPDLLLLDSAGHLGFVEFLYVLDLLKYPCYMIFDDVFHVKHFPSLQYMKEDSRFEILKVSEEKFGFCISFFTP
jgi:hypothetical protein